MNYNLKINDMRRLTSSGSLSNVAFEVNYNIHMTGSDNNIYTKSFFAPLRPVASSNFTSWDSLTEAKVSSWVTGSMVWDEHLQIAEAYLSASMEPVESRGLPW
jgi:hypothetical protein